MGYKNEEQFIDMDSEHHSESSTYDQLIVQQIKKTAEILSKERFTEREKIFTDNRESCVNHVDTLKKMLMPFLDNGDYVKKIKKVEKELEEEIEKYGEKTTLVQGVGYVKIKNVLHNKTSIHYSKLLELKYENAREVFGILILGYQKNKQYLAEFSYE